MARIAAWFAQRHRNRDTERNGRVTLCAFDSLTKAQRPLRATTSRDCYVMYHTHEEVLWLATRVSFYPCVYILVCC